MRWALWPMSLHYDMQRMGGANCRGGRGRGVKVYLEFHAIQNRGGFELETTAAGTSFTNLNGIAQRDGKD